MKDVNDVTFNKIVFSIKMTAILVLHTMALETTFIIALITKNYQMCSSSYNTFTAILLQLFNTVFNARPLAKCIIDFRYRQSCSNELIQGYMP